MDEPEVSRVGAGSAGGAMLKDLVGAAMFDMVNKVSQDLKIGGASIVLMGVKLWFDDLYQFNGPAAADLFRALADLAECKLPEMKQLAEARRRDAVERLFASIHAAVDNEQKLQGAAGGPAQKEKAND